MKSTSVVPLSRSITPSASSSSRLRRAQQRCLLPVGSRRQLQDLSDEMATKVDVQFYSDARDAMLKTMVE